MGAMVMKGQSVDAKTLTSWGDETLQAIRRDYYMPEQKLYGDSAVPGQPPKQVAFNWGVGVLLSALNAAARADRKYDPWLREFADASHIYWNPAPPVAGYDVLPAPKPVDRYYDDNEWMVMGLVEAYEHLKDPKYLQWAKETLNYALSGESPALGGGIFWKEAEKTSKNTCSNGPGAAACLAVYEHTRDEALLKKAVDLYGWTKRNLMDPQDHLMWDSINLQGKIDRTKWSYNTALMIRSAAALYHYTKLPSYQDDAVRFTDASVAKWFGEGKIADGGRFAHLLFESWIFQERWLDRPSKSAAGRLSALTFLRKEGRLPSGHYTTQWNKAPAEPGKALEMIDQASVARAFYMAAQK